MATTKKAAGTKAAAKKAPTKGAAAQRMPKSMPKAGKDPKGGLTEIGRQFFKQTEGANLKPGVRGKADTPEKMERKGSFLRRHYATPRGPVVDDKGKPTRQALQAAAWGEPVPKSEGDEKKLAAKGKELLEQYHALQEAGGAGKKAARKGSVTKAASQKKTAAKKKAAAK